MVYDIYKYLSKKKLIYIFFIFSNTRTQRKILINNNLPNSYTNHESATYNSLLQKTYRN